MADCTGLDSWFDDGWIGRIVKFEHPLYCSWKIVKKLEDHETRYTRDEFEHSGFYSESCCIFICCQDTENPTQAIMKIRMQIPYIGAESSSPDMRAPQARPCQRGQTSREIKALEKLTEAQCPCTPKLIAWKHENQGHDGWVPGGFLDYIVIEKLEGQTLSWELIDSLSNEQQESLRAAFKESYLSCFSHNFVNLDRGARNLIWNEEKNICYIIDWETWYRAKPSYEWDDDEYRLWGLEPS
ncbi:conserved hypothetical protein [Paecilomyces variotii No. 5]|uniref:Aminoglycoside phosphotransferase domain-containing protein n=1 Tax=Byssochlamys spectabilis (strain No. 5 / NBRC 109023) TaxID=1356009 RepID=V5I594_BYSSN|nr:conserved hypothetical protein [Paecilomyces variotii No. 5]